MKISPPVVAVVLTALSRYVVAQSAEISAKLCCAALQSSRVGHQVVFPNSTAYENSVHSYFGVNAQLDPTCIIQPLSAQDVATAVKILTTSKASPCLFAVRSGGHTTTVGAANIDPGVTIDLSLLNSTTYNKQAGTASIHSGSRWSAVYRTLLQEGVLTPGGRTADVGVGGYLTGGGNSFYAARLGFGCDNVVNYEVVLANGDIVNANSSSYADLYKALKGGTINFGIVTRFDEKTFPAEDLWGGIVVYNISTAPQQISASKNFIDNIPNDPFASWFAEWGYNSTTDDTIIYTALDYTKPVAYPAAFDDFYQIPNITDTVRFASVLELATENSQAQGYRNVVQTGTYLNSEDLIQKTMDILTRQIEEAKSRAQGKDYGPVVIIQPWVPLFWKNSFRTGGNVLGLNRVDKPMIMVLWDYSWDSEKDDDLFFELAESAQSELDEYAKDVGAFNEYIYLNYAGGNQNPLAGYGPENVAFLKKVAQKYDPQGVFQTLVPGGYKISKV